MRRGLLVRLAVLSLLSGFVVTAEPRPQAPVPTASPTSTSTPYRALLDQYCVACHNERTKTAGLALDTRNIADVSKDAEVWEKVVRKVRAGMMPPASARRPDAAASGMFVSWLESELDKAAAAHVNAGRIALHRLNRTEYGSAVRDILGVEVDATSLLPPDDSSYGFDNMAGTLGLSPVLLERYVAAASKISRMAIGDPTVTASQQTYAVRADLTQDRHIEGLPFGTRGGLVVQHNIPVDGEYQIRVRLLHAPAGGLFGVNVKGERLEVLVDGERVKLFDIDTDGEKMDFRVPVKAGAQSIGAAFLSRDFVSEDAIGLRRTTIEPTMCAQPGWTCMPAVASITITGPFNVSGLGDTPSRKLIFTCRPSNASAASAASAEGPCARQIVSQIARRAFRRPATPEQLETLMNFYQSGRQEGGFEQGIEMALRRILASPEFLFRVEDEPRNVAAGAIYRISDLDLASRLSFFLWSSIPDDELVKVATQGKLRDAGVLEQQVRRMLADPRSQALVKNFSGQWLYLRNLEGATPSVREYPEFDDNLRQSFRRETELLFDSIIRENRNVVDLLTADYTFLNERLARHYGMPNVYGDHFRRVTLGAGYEVRRGLLGQGSFLTVTSSPTRTSPVLRGKWVLENILGSPPPEPPPDVPDLKENSKDKVVKGQALSVRQLLEEHRTNASCAGCHRIMDPIGFALDNFDGVGKWRTMDGNTPIDASGQLIDGTRLDGPASLRQALVARSDQFVETLAEKLLTYALGRGLEYYDMPVVRSIRKQAEADNYRFLSIVMGIVKSTPFQMEMKAQNDKTAAILNVHKETGR